VIADAWTAPKSRPGKISLGTSGKPIQTHGIGQAEDRKASLIVMVTLCGYGRVLPTTVYTKELVSGNKNS